MEFFDFNSFACNCLLWLLANFNYFSLQLKQPIKISLSQQLKAKLLKNKLLKQRKLIKSSHNQLQKALNQQLKQQ